MKSFRGTVFSDLIRVARTLEVRENERESTALLAVDRAIGPKGVAKARAKLKKLREGRHDRIMRAFKHETMIILAHHRVMSEREVGGDTHPETIEAWVDLELMHLLHTLLM